VCSHAGFVVNHLNFGPERPARVVEIDSVVDVADSAGVSGVLCAGLAAERRRPLRPAGFGRLLAGIRGDRNQVDNGGAYRASAHRSTPILRTGVDYCWKLREFLGGQVSL